MVLAGKIWTFCGVGQFGSVTPMRFCENTKQKRYINECIMYLFLWNTQRDEMRNLFVKLCKFETPVFLRLCFPRCSTFIRLRKIPKFYLISWCGNFVERYNFSRILGDSPETLSKLCLSTKFPHQVIRWNFGILRSTRFPWFTSFYRLINLG